MRVQKVPKISQKQDLGILTKDYSINMCFFLKYENTNALLTICRKPDVWILIMPLVFKFPFSFVMEGKDTKRDQNGLF